MLLTQEKSLCQRNQKIIVSRDKGSQVEHRATNPEGAYSVRQYRLDGDLVKQKKCCDYLLVNDSLKKAYLIELKGANLEDAIPQLEEGERAVASELQNYLFYYRVVLSRVLTHNVGKNSVRKFQEKHGARFQYASRVMKEQL